MLKWLKAGVSKAGVALLCGLVARWRARLCRVVADVLSVVLVSVSSGPYAELPVVTVLVVLWRCGVVG